MKEINGLTLKEMFISGANNLYNNYPAIDALNVFPVPDGDTGINMNLTVSSGAKEIANRNDTDVNQIAKSFSKGLLMGARGNSGVITSQIFRGFAKAIEEMKVINAITFSEAWLMARDVSYKAVMRPVEGTILTVMRESAEFLNDHVKADWSIEKCMDILLQEAKASLERTPDLLPVLKEVGVVDSGGAGLVTIFEGMRLGLMGKMVAKATATAVEAKKESTTTVGDSSGYQLEFVLLLGVGQDKRPYQEKRFQTVLTSQGDDVEITKEDNLLKVKINTPKPGNTFNYAQQFGEFAAINLQNLAQTDFDEEKAFTGAKTSEQKEFAIIAVASGDGLEKVFKEEYRVDYIVKGGQTMNPSTEDFLAAIKLVNAKNVILLPNNGNIVMAANQACDVLRDDPSVNAYMIPTKTIPQGLVAAMNFNPEVSIEDNLREMKDAISSVATGQVTFAIKDTTIEGIEVKKDFYMALNGKNILCSVENKYDALNQLLEKMIDEISSVVTLIYGEDIKEEDANELEEQLQEKYPDIDFEFINGQQPVYSFIVGVE